MLYILLHREEEAVTSALDVGVGFAKEICKLICGSKGEGKVNSLLLLS